MFITLLIVCTGLILGTAAVRGPRNAAVLAFALAMIMPNWLVREAGAVVIDLRLACAVLGIGCVAFHPQTCWRWQPLAADFVVVGLVGVQMTSELLSSEPTLTTLLDIALQWFLPYALGRIVWRSLADGERLLPPAAWCCVVLGIWALFESITRINPVSVALGYTGSLQGLTDIRWGLKRAEGPLMHPIFFGLQMMLLFPFALEAARRSRLQQGPPWWRWTPWLAAAGAFCSMSRGPQLGTVAVALIALVILVARWRLPIIVPALLGVGFLACFPDVALETLHRWSGEQPTMAIEIRGEHVPYTGTMHRLLQLRVYEEALYNAGWFGYGSTTLRATGTKIPYIEEHLRQMFSSIDNHYLQFTLQDGYAGIALFLALCSLGICYASAAVGGANRDFSLLAAGIVGALLTMVVLLSTVWLAADGRFPLLAVIGIAGGMRMSAGRAAVPHSEPVRSLPLRLVPGHPPLHPC